MALGAFALSIMINELRGRRAPQDSSPEADTEIGPEWPKVAIALVALAAFAIFLNRLGYILSTFIMMAVLLRIVASYRWAMVVGVAIAISAVSVALFGALGVHLPGGVLPLFTR
jgi:hypothetical protein